MDAIAARYLHRNDENTYYIVSQKIYYFPIHFNHGCYASHYSLLLQDIFKVVDARHVYRQLLLAETALNTRGDFEATNPFPRGFSWDPLAWTLEFRFQFYCKIYSPGIHLTLELHLSFSSSLTVWLHLCVCFASKISC